MEDYQGFMNDALKVKVGNEYLCFDAKEVAHNNLLCTALLIMHRYYKDIVWC